MASLPQPTATSPLSPMIRQRLTLLVLVVISLVSMTLAIVAVQRPSPVPVAPTPVPIVPASAPSGPTGPGAARNGAVIDAHEQLQLQWLAAEQALRAGNTEAYEIAVSGAEALQHRIATLQAQQQAALAVERAIIDAYEQLQFQRLAAAQALRARNSEAYEMATAGAEALLSRIATLQAQHPRD